MGTPTLCSLLLPAFLIHFTASLDSLHFCSECFGFCDSINGCLCADGIESCLPDSSVPCTNPNLCCPDGLYYNSESSLCTETVFCYPPCAADEIMIIPCVCACNSSIYQDIALADLKLVQTCDIGAITVGFSQCLLSALGYDHMSVHLNTSDYCHIMYSNVTNGQKMNFLQVWTAVDWCGNTVMKRGSRSFVTNTVIFDVQKNVSASPLNFPIICPLYDGTNLLAQTVVISLRNGTDLFPITMGAYKDPEFLNPYESGDNVTGPEIHVAVYAYIPDGDIYALRLQDCIASPTANRSDRNALRIVSNGCAADHWTTITQNGESSEVRMVIDYYKVKGFPKVYLFCDARYCVKSEEPCTMCTESGFNRPVTELQLQLLMRGNPQQEESVWPLAAHVEQPLVVCWVLSFILLSSSSVLVCMSLPSLWFSWW